MGVVGDIGDSSHSLNGIVGWHETTIASKSKFTIRVILSGK
jgi:hypothetical protein